MVISPALRRDLGNPVLRFLTSLIKAQARVHCLIDKLIAFRKISDRLPGPYKPHAGTPPAHTISLP